MKFKTANITFSGNSVQILPVNSLRKYIKIENTGSTNFYIIPKSESNSNEGGFLLKPGRCFEMDQNDYPIYTGILHLNGADGSTISYKLQEIDD